MSTPRLLALALLLLAPAPLLAQEPETPAERPVPEQPAETGEQTPDGETTKEEPKPVETPAADPERRTDSGTTPRRLGGDRLKGIKIKPRPQVGPVRPPVQAPTTGPVADPDAADPHAGHDHGPVTTGALAPPQGKGGLAVDGGNQIQNFGDLIQGDVRDHTFKGKSTGEDPLVISTLNKTCGCTRAEIQLIGADGELTPYRLGQGIEPGTEFLLHTTLDTTGKANHFKSDITLTTNDPRRGIAFSLVANVKPALSVNPRSLNLGTMRSSDTKKGQVVLTSEAFGKFKLSLDPNIPLRGVTCELVPTDPDADGKSHRWVAKFEAGPGLPEGAFNQPVRFLTDLVQEGKTLGDGSPVTFDAILYLIANVQGPVTVNPPHVSFGLLRPGQALTRRTTISVTDETFSLPTDMTWSIKGYGVDFPYPDDFEVQVVPIEGTRNLDLVISLLGIDDIPGNGSFRGYVELQVGHPSKPTIDVGFSGVIRAGVGQ